LASQDAEKWLSDQGLSNQGICRTAVFNLSGPNARQQAAILGQQFKLTPDACATGDIQEPTPPSLVAGNTPDTDIAYKQSAAQGTQQIEATVDPLQMQARLILELPFQGPDFSLKYDYATNTFTKILRQGKEDEGDAEFEEYLAQHSVDEQRIRHLITVIAPPGN